ncbi:NYN domain-containing protein [Streptomyces chartreusis]
MSAPGVIIDASNVAATRKRPWPFSRVVDVREAWLRDHPGTDAVAVLDASVRPVLDDQHLVEQAERAHWLEVHQGDADDRILALADQFDAAIVSSDNFRYARREHPWLQGNGSRVWSVRRMRGQIMFSPRQLGVASDEEIERDRQKKLSKAGLLSRDAEERFRCTSAPAGCLRGGEVLLPRQVNKDGARWYCLSCGYEAVELIAEPPLTGGPDDGPVHVTVQHGYTVRRTITVPADGLSLGRASRSRPGGTDVTEGLGRDAADEISRTHLRIFLDDDGKPLVEHVPEQHVNVSFLNPELDFEGRPRSGRLATALPYALEDGDELHLGPGTVRLRIRFGGEL